MPTNKQLAELIQQDHLTEVREIEMIGDTALVFVHGVVLPIRCMLGTAILPDELQHWAPEIEAHLR